MLAIDRRGPGVAVHTSQGMFTARAAIVTVSVGVLQAGRIAFDTDVFGGLADTPVLIPLAPAGSDLYLGIFAKLFGQDMAVVITGGAACRRAEEDRAVGRQVDVLRRAGSGAHQAGMTGSRT